MVKRTRQGQVIKYDKEGTGMDPNTGTRPKAKQGNNAKSVEYGRKPGRTRAGSGHQVESGQDQEIR